LLACGLVCGVFAVTAFYANLYPMAEKKKSLFESIPFLIILGILAGAVGGAGVGLIQLRAISSSSSTNSSPSK
jgi:H+/Cl- antiporter ClcA